MGVAMLSLHSCPLGRLGTRDTGGMNVYVRETARDLAALGVKVDVFTREHPSDAHASPTPSKDRTTVVIVGGAADDGEEAQELRQLAQEHGIGKQVSLLLWRTSLAKEVPPESKNP